MSCLTRELQQRLTRYLRSQSKPFSGQNAETVRNALVNEGLCPSDVTTDQVRVMLKMSGLAAH